MPRKLHEPVLTDLPQKETPNDVPLKDVPLKDAPLKIYPMPRLSAEHGSRLRPGCVCSKLTCSLRIRSSTNGSTNEILAYAAAANGKLSPITGSPFPDNVSSMAVNGKYLMAANVAKPNIDTFKIESNGALTYASSINYQKYDYGCGYAGPIFFDHTGATLYVMESDGSSACANTVYASYAVAPATGKLKYLGMDVTGVFPGSWYAASFIGNNVYAYTAEDEACMYYEIYGFKRKTNGLLTSFNVKANYPPPPNGVSGYIANMSAADPTNHLAFTMQPANPPDCASGPLQLASYTADSSGNLRTTNTYKNMPAPLIANPSDMKMSPSGKLLAYAGGEGLQIFHFNGASPDHALHRPADYRSHR